MQNLLSTKRASQLRSLRTWLILLVLLAVSLLIAYILYRRVSSYPHPHGSFPKGELEMDATSPEEGLQFGRGRLRFIGPLPVLYTRGSPYEVGAQHGRLRARAVSELHSVFQTNVSATVSAGGIAGKTLHNSRLRWSWRALDDGIPGHQLFEISGIAKGAKRGGHSVPYDDLVRQSAIFDIGAADPSSSGASSWTLMRSLSALVPIQSEVAQSLLVARSLAMPGASDGGAKVRKNMHLHISHPDKGLATASLGWAGLAGIVSGVNERGIGVFVHPIRSSETRVTREAQPSPLVAKEALENANTLSEAIELLRKAKVLGSAVFVIVEGSTRKWAIIERTPSRSEMRIGDGSELVVDTLLAQEFKDDPIIERSSRTRPMLARRDRGKRILRRGKTSASEVIALLRDRNSKTDSILPLGHREAIDDPESVQSAIFDPGAMVLWVSESGDSSDGFRAIDLAHALGGQGTKNAPPAGYPGVKDSESQRDAVREARMQLREARKLFNEGKLSLARASASTALARRPTLPESLYVAGEFARKAKDELAARALFQRFLEVGADDRAAEEQAKAWLGF